MNLDKKDREILYYLDENSFQSFSSIAKKTRLSKQVVAYRINELKEKGILVKTCAIINLAKLGYGFYKFYIKYKTVTKEKEKPMLEKLGKHPRVGYMCGCDGKFDLFVGVWAKDTHELYSLSRELFNEYKIDFEEIVVSIMEIALNSKRGYLINQETNAGVPLFGGTIEKMELDDIDKMILQTLSENARTRYVEIAKKTNLTPAAVGYRIKNMKRRRIIEGARIVLDKAKIGYLVFKVLIKTGLINENEIKKFIRYVTKEKNIIDIDLTLGNWDIEIDVEIESHEKFHQLMLKIRSVFPKLIGSYDTLLIFKEYVYDYFPVLKNQ